MTPRRDIEHAINCNSAENRSNDDSMWVDRLADLHDRVQQDAKQWEIFHQRLLKYIAAGNRQPDERA